MTKIELIPPTPDLAELFYRWRQDPVMNEYNPLAPSTIEMLRERLSKASYLLSEYEKAEAFFWIVRFEAEMVGHVSLQNVNKMMKTAEVGFGIAPQARSKGLATQTVRLIAEEVFCQTPIRKLIAYVHEKNLPSVKVLEKVGFKREGLLREHYLVNGKPVNEFVYGLLKSEII